VDVACPRESQVWERVSGLDRVRLHAVGAHRRPAPGDARSLATLLPLVRGADVVHAHSSKAGFLARQAAALTGRRDRVVFTPHGWSFWAADGAESRLYVGLERLAAHWCRAIVALSGPERDAGIAERIGRPERYRVIPNGVEPSLYAAGPEPVPGRVLAVGRLAKPKRFDLVLRAFASLAEEVPGAELEIAGDGPLRGDLESLTASLGLEQRVRFLGDRDDVPGLLSRASAFVLASDYEGCPLAVIEALAAGVPVAATAVGGVPELVDTGTGILAPAGDEGALADALRTLLLDPARARALGEAGRRTVAERLSHDVMVSRLLDLYREMVGR
jgi:glycosyltransferase involved in cell wall biosynthesis